MGVRIEHKQDFISESQYGKFAKYLPPASYNLWSPISNGRNVYTFCMCPGVVVAAWSEKEVSCKWYELFRKVCTFGIYTTRGFWN